MFSIFKKKERTKTYLFSYQIVPHIVVEDNCRILKYYVLVQIFSDTWKSINEQGKINSSGVSFFKNEDEAKKAVEKYALRFQVKKENELELQRCPIQRYEV